MPPPAATASSSSEPIFDDPIPTGPKAPPPLPPVLPLSPFAADPYSYEKAVSSAKMAKTLLTDEAPWYTFLTVAAYLGTKALQFSLPYAFRFIKWSLNGVVYGIEWCTIVLLWCVEKLCWIAGGIVLLGTVTIGTGYIYFKFEARRTRT